MIFTHPVSVQLNIFPFFFRSMFDGSCKCERKEREKQVEGVEEDEEDEEREEKEEKTYKRMTH
jgi:hypothetical protein